MIDKIHKIQFTYFLIQVKQKYIINNYCFEQQNQSD